MEPLLHTIASAQERIPVGRSTMYELIKAGKLRVLKIGSRTFIADEELKRFAADLEASQAGDE